MLSHCRSGILLHAIASPFPWRKRPALRPHPFPEPAKLCTAASFSGGHHKAQMTAAVAIVAALLSFVGSSTGKTLSQKCSGWTPEDCTKVEGCMNCYDGFRVDCFPENSSQVYGARSSNGPFRTLVQLQTCFIIRRSSRIHIWSICASVVSVAGRNFAERHQHLSLLRALTLLCRDRHPC